MRGWLKGGLALAPLLLAASGPVHQSRTVESGLALEVRSARGTLAAAFDGARTFLLPPDATYQLHLSNPSNLDADATVWRLVGTSAVVLWEGRVAAGAVPRVASFRADGGTEVVLVRWARVDAPATSDAQGVMEGDESRVYYLVSDAADRMAALGPQARPRLAPEPDSALEAEFDAASAGRREAFEQLLATRGAQRKLVGIPNFKALRLALTRVYEPGTAMLMYAPVGDTLTTWMITPRGELLRHVQGDLERRGHAFSTLRRALRVDELQAHRSPRSRGTHPAAPAGAPPPLEGALRDVADLLLPRPFHRALREARHLVIVPALEIGAVPIAALPHPRGGQVVDHASVVVAPSICDVIQLGHRVHFTDVAAAPLILGDPAFPETGDWLFPPLPGAAAEAQAVAARLGASWYTGTEATKALLEREAPRASLLYLATHGIASATDVMNASFLQFAGSGRAGRYTAADIQRARLRARLTVLSACQTGLGLAHDGGIIGVARSFINAGSSQVVMSLWNVDDAATTALMLSFVDALVDAPPPEALRRAMLAARGPARRGASPALWASFTVLGATW